MSKQPGTALHRILESLSAEVDRTIAEARRFECLYDETYPMVEDLANDRERLRRLAAALKDENETLRARLASSRDEYRRIQAVGETVVWSARSPLLGDTGV